MTNSKSSPDFSTVEEGEDTTTYLQDYSEHCCDQSLTCYENFLQCTYKFLLTSVKYWDDDWRLKRGLEPYDHMLNFYLSVALLWFFTCGFTMTGLSFVGQYGCVGLEQTYEQQECFVHEGVAVQYSLEGYVDTHWVPLRVSAFDSKTGSIIANVTGVVGGWMFIDRFPMPPVHGRITAAPPGESVFSNDVAVNAEQAFKFLDNHLGKVFPCIVPKPSSSSFGAFVDSKDRKRIDCTSTGCLPATNGMYPFDWALEDLLSLGKFRHDMAVCDLNSRSSTKTNNNANVGTSPSSSSSDATHIFANNSNVNYDHQLIIASLDENRQVKYGMDEYVNAGDEFACSGRIIFVNATLKDEVQVVVDGFWLFFIGGVSCLALWPIVCVCGRIHGWVWTMMYGYKVTGFVKDNINPLGNNKEETNRTDKTMSERAKDARYFNHLKRKSHSSNKGRGAISKRSSLVMGDVSGGAGAGAGAVGDGRKAAVELSMLTPLKEEGDEKNDEVDDDNYDDRSRRSTESGLSEVKNDNNDTLGTAEKKSNNNQPSERRAQQLLLLKLKSTNAMVKHSSTSNEE
jgi:hypothetical protein